MTLDLLRLKAERVAKGLSQDEMARKMGWKTRTPYAKRENGIVNIGADELVKMASILGYSKNELGIFFTTTVPKKERL
ncbi:helix-turn-helix domain-containing protein [Ruoffia sp. FAM 24228]|uniref:helix-turn-helix domain-containing protein n=1 Tax=Ruoffia sp. FAM 24228 TaxID=3259517 RepID=UPI003884E8CE